MKLRFIKVRERESNRYVYKNLNNLEEFVEVASDKNYVALRFSDSVGTYFYDSINSLFQILEYVYQ